MAGILAVNYHAAKAKASKISCMELHSRRTRIGFSCATHLPAGIRINCGLLYCKSIPSDFVPLRCEEVKDRGRLQL